MGRVFSLQGSMAVGKTTALKLIEQVTTYHISFEENQQVIKAINRRQLDNNNQKDYLEIQKLWIKEEIVRWQNNQKYPITLQDFGAEEIEFYTLNYPLSLHKNWKVEHSLNKPLQQLKRYQPERILFLDAQDTILEKRKQADSLRSRSFFDYQLKHLLPLKRDWFSKKENVDFLDVSYLTKEQTAKQVVLWLERQIKNDEKNKLS